MFAFHTKRERIDDDEFHVLFSDFERKMKFTIRKHI